MSPCHRPTLSQPDQGWKSGDGGEILRFDGSDGDGDGGLIPFHGKTVVEGHSVQIF